MWLFGRQYPNFLRFYSNLLDVVFLLYDLTHLLQWQYLIDFHHPHHVSISPAVLRSFFTTEQSTTTVFVSRFHPVVQMCSFLTPAQSLLCTQLCSQPPRTPQPRQPQPPTSLSSPNPAHFSCHQSGDAWDEVELLGSHSSSCHSLFPGTHTDFRKRYCHFLNSVSSLDTHFSFPGISE